jgi:hypothetical protein
MLCQFGRGHEAAVTVATRERFDASVNPVHMVFQGRSSGKAVVAYLTLMLPAKVHLQ